MKMFTKIVTIAAFTTYMFAGINLTWGNSYTDNGTAMAASSEFGIWFDMNDATSIGWENNSIMIGLAGPAGLQFRLGYETVTTLGVGRSWWSSTGNGWATSLNTTLDFTLVDSTPGAGDAGDFQVGINLGFGF